MIGFATVGLILLLAALAALIWVLASGPQLSDLWTLGDTAALGPDALRFCLDYVRRNTAYRRAGAVIAAVLGGVWSMRWSGQVTLWGIPSTTQICPPLAQCTAPSSGALAGTTVFAAVFGTLLGALLAESYHLRPGHGPRQASLDARPPHQLPRLAHASWLVIAAAIMLAGLDWARTGTPGLALGLLPGLAGVVLAEAVQHAVVGRRRPILGDQAMLVDRMLRRAVAASAVWLELAAAILCLGWTTMGAGTGLLGTTSTPAWENVLGGVLGAAGFVAIVPALVCVHRGALARVHWFTRRAPATVAP